MRGEQEQMLSGICLPFISTLSCFVSKPWYWETLFSSVFVSGMSRFFKRLAGCQTDSCPLTIGYPGTCVPPL